MQLRYLTEKKIIRSRTQEREILTIRLSVKFHFRGHHVSLILHPFTTPNVYSTTHSGRNHKYTRHTEHHHEIMKPYKHRDGSKMVGKGSFRRENETKGRRRTRILEIGLVGPIYSASPPTITEPLLFCKPLADGLVP